MDYELDKLAGTDVYRKIWRDGFFWASIWVGIPLAVSLGYVIWR